jgi:hypothetical protein
MLFAKLNQTIKRKLFQCQLVVALEIDTPCPKIKCDVWPAKRMQDVTLAELLSTGEKRIA